MFHLRLIDLREIVLGVSPASPLLSLLLAFVYHPWTQVPTGGRNFGHDAATRDTGIVTLYIHKYMANYNAIVRVWRPRVRMM